GLDRIDRLGLETIIHKFGGGPVGLQTLAAAMSEETETLELVHEPFLLKQGLISRTPRGRVVTARAYTHLNLPQPAV
ncbi:ATP-dependent DNA helicase RuvB, partial [Parcubacteria bacterium SG8_24]